MLNGINLENNDISKLLKSTKKNIKSANGSYNPSRNDSFAVVDTDSDNSSEVSTYDKKGVISKKEFYLKDSTILPERYNTKVLSGGIYYQGEKISQMELIEKAVESGAIELNEDESIWDNYSKAWEALVEDNAKPLYSWSKSLYSEDGMYKFRIEDGDITGVISTKNSSGVSLQDMAKELANGKSPDEIPDVSWLSWNDRELFEAAYNIGKAKSLYFDLTNDYNSNQISYEDYVTSLEPLFFLLNDSYAFQDIKLDKLNETYTNENFAELALKNYNPTKYSIIFDEEEF